MTQNTYCIHGKVRQSDEGTHYECLYYPHPVFQPLQIFTKSKFRTSSSNYFRILTHKHAKLNNINWETG